MGRIIIHDGPAKRPIRVDNFDGVIELDLRGDPTVALPEGIEVVRTSSAPE